MTYEKNAFANKPGQLGVATSSSWKWHPMLEPHDLPLGKIENRIDADFYEKVINGFIPTVMEQKWFVFVENDIIHICRSWTGFEIYKAEFVKKDSGIFVENLKVERSKKRYDAHKFGSTTDKADSHDIQLFIHCMSICINGAPFWEP